MLSTIPFSRFQPLRQLCQRLALRPFSTTQSEPPRPTATRPQVLHNADGTQYVAFDLNKYPKLKPNVVRRRLARCRTYIGQEKDIRQSPWRLNLVCQLAAGLTLQEALIQVEYSRKTKAAPVVGKVLQRTANLADIRDGLQPSQLEVAECFATKGTPLKRIMIMGRGRNGRMTHPYAHMRLVLREIDWELKQVQATTLNQKKRWFRLQQQAESDYARASAEREQEYRLEQQAKATQENTDKSREAHGVDKK